MSPIASEWMWLVRAEREARLQENAVYRIRSRRHVSLVGGDQLGEFAREPFEIPGRCGEGPTKTLRVERILHPIVPRAEEPALRELIARECVGPREVTCRPGKRDRAALRGRNPELVAGRQRHITLIDLVHHFGLEDEGLVQTLLERTPAVCEIAADDGLACADGVQRTLDRGSVQREWLLNLAGHRARAQLEVRVLREIDVIAEPSRESEATQGLVHR